MIAFTQISIYPNMKLSPSTVARRASLNAPVTAAFSVGYKLLAGVDEVVSFIPNTNFYLISFYDESIVVQYQQKRINLLTHLLLWIIGSRGTRRTGSRCCGVIARIS